MTVFNNLLAAMGGVGNAAGVKGAGPTGLNALQRASLTPEQSSALTQLNAAAANPLDMSNPDLPKEASANPALAKRMSDFINLQRQQAMQPFALGMINHMVGSGGTPSTNAPAGGAAPMGTTAVSGKGAPYDSLRDQMINAARFKFALTGDPTELEKAYQSAFENDPVLAGSKTRQQQGNTLFKTPEGTYAAGNAIFGGGGGTGGNRTKSAPVELSPTDENQPDYLTQLTETKSNPSTPSVPVAEDGKPVLPDVSPAWKPNQQGIPAYKLPNTTTGVNQTKIFQEADAKANQAFSANLDSVQTEKFRIQQLADIYKQVQAGTLTAQSPEFFNRLAAIGVHSDPQQLKDLGNIQAAMQNHIFQILSQYKDVNTNGENTPSRLFSGVINTLLEEGENSGKQPQSLFKVLSQAQALTDRKIDMYKNWQKIGGLGNRIANGYTMRPDDFQRDFELNHDLDPYEKAAEKEIGPLNGMEGNNGTWSATPKGTKYRIVK